MSTMVTPTTKKKAKKAVQTGFVIKQSKKDRQFTVRLFDKKGNKILKFASVKTLAQADKQINEYRTLVSQANVFDEVLPTKQQLAAQAKAKKQAKQAKKASKKDTIKAAITSSGPVKAPKPKKAKKSAINSITDLPISIG